MDVDWESFHKFSNLIMEVFHLDVGHLYGGTDDLALH